MNREDYIELVHLLETGLREAVISDLTDPSLYVERDSDTGELRHQHPRDHLVELLKALDRYLAVSDRGTYNRALELINEVVDSPRVLGAGGMPLDVVASEPFSLEVMPHLGADRNRIAELIEQIRADPEPDRETNR